MSKDKLQKLAILVLGFVSGYGVSGKLYRGEDLLELFFPLFLLVAGVFFVFSNPKK